VSLSESDLAASKAFPSFQDAIPVLTFHDVSTTNASDYTVSPEQLASDLSALRIAGFHSVGLDDVSRFISGESKHLPSRPVLLTFDDGPASNWTVADGILAEYGFRAVAFLVTGRIADHEPSYYLTWDQARSMRDSGRWEFGAHTHDSHGYVPLADGGAGPALINRTVLPDGSAESFEQWQSRAKRDLDANARAMERELGRDAVDFAFPFGAAEVPSNDFRIPPTLADMVSERYHLGFRGTMPDPVIVPSSTRQSLSRITVTSKMSPSDLLSRLKADIPFPPPVDLSTQSWHSGEAGSCEAAGGGLSVRTSAFNRCELAGNPVRWENYRLSTTVQGSGRAATAIIAVRSSKSGRIEVAMGESTARVRQQIGKDPFVTLGEIPLQPAAPDGRSVRLTAQGDHLTVEIDAQPRVVLTTDPSLRIGFAGFAVAATGEQTVTFDRPTVRSLSADSSFSPLQIGPT
jgi:peptidoglycan/xylan/chitin deacetylase (PgdA/CDA1 family)